MFFSLYLSLSLSLPHSVGGGAGELHSGKFLTCDSLALSIKDRKLENIHTLTPIRFTLLHKTEDNAKTKIRVVGAPCARESSFCGCEKKKHKKIILAEQDKGALKSNINIYRLISAQGPSHSCWGVVVTPISIARRRDSRAPRAPPPLAPHEHIVSAKSVACVRSMFGT